MKTTNLHTVFNHYANEIIKSNNFKKSLFFKSIYYQLLYYINYIFKSSKCKSHTLFYCKNVL